MSWGTELWDQFDNVSGYTQKGIDFCEKFSHFLKERSSIENDYAGKLKKLVKSYSQKKKDDDGFTTSKGFETMVRELYDLAGQHESIAEALQNNVCKELLDTVQTLKQERKKLLQDAARQDAAVQAQLSQLDKAKKAYEKAFREAEKAQEAYKKGDQDIALSKAEVEKFKNISITRQQQCEDSKKEYGSEVEKTRVSQADHYQDKLPQIFQQLQDMDKRRIMKVQECIRNTADSDKRTLPIITKCIEGMADAASLVDSERDSQMVIDKFKTGFAPTLDVPFEDLSNPLKNSNSGSNTKLTVSGKTKKRAGLLGIFGGGQKGEEPKEDFSHLPPNQQKKHLLAKIDAIKSSITKETSQRDGMVKMQDVISSNAKMGNATVIAKQLEENGQILDHLRQELNKYESYLAEAEVRLQESGHTPNASPNIHRKEATPQATDTSDGNANTRQSAVVPGNQDPLPSPQPLQADDGFSDDEFGDGGTCTALYAYDGTGDGSLCMAVGQQFTVIDHDQGDGWTQVRGSDKTVGYVPTSYIKFN